ncbi:uncharacterized protein LOC126100578 isoform X1 [Schistocerca cancellata]|uniref:uncharacterized protein LOC126100578 isoform X1 n=1 Tax=Schistocerca cancellata TaxID=274614 RepID=UPI0021177591|nr:uncharacterized protein LOC126100578 isoform X1 [Schistocerca cancellata]
MSPLSAFLVLAVASAGSALALQGYQQPVVGARGFADPRAAAGLGYGGPSAVVGGGPESSALYRSQIYTDPEYYGYESTFPGGRSNFKAYRSVPEGPAGLSGGATGAYGDYDSVVVAGRGANRPGLSPQAGVGLRGRY